MESLAHLPRVRYNDFYFRLIVSVIGAHFVVMFGEKISLFQAILMPAYYIALGGSAIIAFLLINTIWAITVWLDKRYDWYEQPYLRSAYQLLVGIVLTSLLAFILAALYFYIRGQNILDTLYLQFDYPVIILLLILLNSYYIIHYFVKVFHTRYENIDSPELEATRPIQIPNEERSATAFSYTHPGFPVPADSIGYISLEPAGLYLYTFEGTRRALELSVHQVMESLDHKGFYQVNRQMIISFEVIRQIKPYTRGSVEVIFVQPLDKSVIVSRRRARDFKKWFNRDR
jgi:hypothetical protein